MTRLKILILAITYTTTVFGQQNRLDIGVEGSPSITSIRGIDILREFYHPTLGYSGGLSFQYNFTKKVSFRVEGLFERKGSVLKEIFTDEYGNYTPDIKAYSYYKYLVFPFLFRAEFGNTRKLFLHGGYFLGYLLNETTVFKGNIMNNKTYDDTKNFKRIDNGFTSGIGALIPIKNNFSISCEIRNNLGLYDISALPIINKGSIKTNSTNLIFSIAYKIGTQTDTK